ncbi:MAG: TfoX/Sxy family protein [Alphaproteobacteria bacterium]|nr:TfoX/Sxy family protein [Alphaproteobacteria bacterium]
MAVSQDFMDFACELFSGLGPTRARRMFGGAGVYAHDLMFALIADDVIHIKAEGALAEDLEAEGCGAFVFTPKSGEPAEMGYRRLPEAALDEPELACEWGRRALDLALSKKR